MNTLKFILVLSLILVSFDFAYRTIVDHAYGQANQGPLRHMPQIEEDQIIICVKDVKHKAYFGQLSCIINNDGLDNPLLRKLGDKAMSLKDTFEMGLID